MNCLGCFALSQEVYCKRCRKELFDNQKIDFVLDFDKKEFLSQALELSSQMSISGVQDKISLKIQDKKLVPTTKNGTYLLKPIPLMEYGELITDVAKNEHFSMQLASQVFKLETAINGLIAFSDGELAYMTKRFDRIDGAKIKQEDFASLAERSEQSHGKDYKYDYSYEEIGGLIKQYLPAYKVEMVSYFKLVLFNYLIGNGDAHLKNFSVYQRVTGDYGLTPAYDLLSSSIHLPNESGTALELFKEYESKSFKANGFYAYNDFIAFGDRLGLSKKMIESILKTFVGQERRVLKLLENSFLSQEAKERYEGLFRDRLRAVEYRFVVNFDE
jgi:serine/threonine-protein kinase HipA